MICIEMILRWKHSISRPILKRILLFYYVVCNFDQTWEEFFWIGFWWMAARGKDHHDPPKPDLVFWASNCRQKYFATPFWPLDLNTLFGWNSTSPKLLASKNFIIKFVLATTLKEQQVEFLLVLVVVVGRIKPKLNHSLPLVSYYNSHQY